MALKRLVGDGVDLSGFEIAQDKARVKKVRRTLADLKAGRNVSAVRLEEGQKFFLDLYTELNSKRSDIRSNAGYGFDD